MGTSGDWLLVAGGSSWTAAPWNGGVKQWSDRVYGLHPGDTQWTLLGHLPYAVGYSAAATWNDELLCSGGENGTELFAKVLELTVLAGPKLYVAERAALTHPLTLARAAVSGNILVVAGGHGPRRPNSVDPAPKVFTLQLDRGSGWRTITPPWKQTVEIPELASCKDGAVLIAGGAEKTGVTSKAVYQRNAWMFLPPSDEWTALPALPLPVTGGAALCSSKGHWLILGGDDGSLADRMAELRDRHPGFEKSILVFDRSRKVWQEAGSVPVSLLGSGGAVWNGRLVLPGGEDRPAHRSGRVLAAPLSAFP